MVLMMVPFILSDNKIENMTPQVRNKQTKLGYDNILSAPGKCGLKVPQLLPISGRFCHLESTEMTSKSITFTPPSQVHSKSSLVESQILGRNGSCRALTFMDFFSCFASNTAGGVTRATMRCSKWPERSPFKSSFSS